MLREEISTVDIKVTHQSNVVFTDRISTLKIIVENKTGYNLESLYLTPPDRLKDKRRVRGVIDGVEVMWGGGVLRGAAVVLPEEREVLEPGEKGVAYFLVYSSSREKKTVTLPLEIHSVYGYLREVKIPLHVYPRDLRAYVYRPRYKPVINNLLLNIVKEKIEEYGIPNVDVHIWRVFPTPKVQILFEGNEVAVISGDIGSGFRHLFKINMHRDMFIGVARDPKEEDKKERWYWVIRVWFLWLDKSLLDEVPDAERIELWINPDTYMVDWVITDEHWKEVTYKGPIERVEANIRGGSRFWRRIIRSYHPPYILNMKRCNVSADCRNPNTKINSIYIV